MKKTKYFIFLIAFLTILISGKAKAGDKFLVQDISGNVLYYHSRNPLLQNARLHTNNRGLTKIAFELPIDQQIQWVSHYGSVTFNYLGKEFPHGGINEAGLTIQLIDQKSKDNSTVSRSSIKLNAFQWIQYQLDNFNSIEDIIQNAGTIGYTEPEGLRFVFFVADARGKTALVSAKNGKVVSTIFNGHKTNSRQHRWSKAAKIKGIKAKNVYYYENIKAMPQFIESTLLMFNPADFSVRYFTSGRNGNIYLNLKNIDFAPENSAFYMSLSRSGVGNPYEIFHSNYENNFRHNYEGSKEINYLNNLNLDHLEAMATYPGSMTFTDKGQDLTKFIE